MAVRNERRTQSRKRPLSLVYVELPPANGGMMRDLSEHGFALRAMMPLHPSEKVAFSFMLDTAARIDGDAIVVRLGDNGHVAALEFAGLPAHSRDQIRRWLEKFDEPPPTEAERPQGPADNSTFEELRTEIRATKERPAPAPRPAEPVIAKLMAAPDPPAAEAEELPPLLKLSSVRPEPAEPAPDVPPPPDIAEEPSEPPIPVFSEEVPEAVPPLFEEVKIPAVPAETAVSPPPALAPALEPLSAFEPATDEESPGWMDHFTLGRAISIMFLLTLLAGSLVYHREVGHALIWLGQKIAGEPSAEPQQPASPPESGQATPAPVLPSIPTSVPPTAPGGEEKPTAEPQSSAATQNAAPAPAAAPTAESNEAKSAALPPAPSTTPTPRLKDSNPPSVVPLTQTDREVRTPAGGSTVPGQAEYQQALAILRAPGRSEELPAAVSLLWAAVEKGNLPAEIALAELYQSGRGVARNCNQARVLLSAAARKGSVDARQRLEQLQRQGCAD